MAGERLVALMQDAARNGIPTGEITDLIWGVVESTNPLIITIMNEPKMRLTSTFLKLSPLCIARTLTIPAYSTENADGHTHTIPARTVVLWEGLKTGDKVIMLRCSKGSLYYVLQKD